MAGPRRRTAVAVVVLALALAGACGTPAASTVWHDGLLSVATGNTTGVYYQVGGGYADVITRHLPGYQAAAEPTAASGDNVARVSRGDAEVAFAQSDVVDDAVKGEGMFNSPQPIRALAQIFPSYITMCVRADARVATPADLRGKRVSTGSPRSGTELVAQRVLRAVGLDPAKDIQAQKWSLTRSVTAMVDGELDALIWAGGLPTPGISDLVDRLKGNVVFLPLTSVVPVLRQQYGPLYQEATLAKGVYHTPADVPAATIGNMIIVPANMPDQLADDLTRLLFDYQPEIAKVHPEGGHFDKALGRRTEPVPLHPGAARRYGKW